MELCGATRESNVELVGRYPPLLNGFPALSLFTEPGMVRVMKQLLHLPNGIGSALHCLFAHVLRDI